MACFFSESRMDFIHATSLNRKCRGYEVDLAPRWEWRDLRFLPPFLFVSIARDTDYKPLTL
jgi:hypothetical protein